MISGKGGLSRYFNLLPSITPLHPQFCKRLLRYFMPRRIVLTNWQHAALFGLTANEDISNHVTAAASCKASSQGLYPELR